MPRPVGKGRFTRKKHQEGEREDSKPRDFCDVGFATDNRFLALRGGNVFQKLLAQREGEVSCS